MKRRPFDCRSGQAVCSPIRDPCYAWLNPKSPPSRDATTNTRDAYAPQSESEIARGLDDLICLRRITLQPLNPSMNHVRQSLIAWQHRGAKRGVIEQCEGTANGNDRLRNAVARPSKPRTAPWLQRHACGWRFSSTNFMARSTTCSPEFRPHFRLMFSR